MVDKIVFVNRFISWSDMAVTTQPTMSITKRSSYFNPVFCSAAFADTFGV